MRAIPYLALLIGVLIAGFGIFGLAAPQEFAGVIASCIRIRLSKHPTHPIVLTQCQRETDSYSDERKPPNPKQKSQSSREHRRMPAAKRPPRNHGTGCGETRHSSRGDRNDPLRGRPSKCHHVCERGNG